MKKIILLVSAFILMFAFSACGAQSSQSTTSQQQESTTELEEETIVSIREENENNSEETAEFNLTSRTVMLNSGYEMPILGIGCFRLSDGECENSVYWALQDADRSNILVAYFSLAGEQYNVGVIEEGNTSIIAQMIAEQTGADMFEIEAVTPYPTSHSELLDVSREEMADNARPEIVGTVDNMSDYDTVFIGYPNWWGDMPMIVYNFIESYDFSGKTIVPFCTHGGSGLSRTESTIADITGANMIDGFAIAGETAQKERDASLERVTAWLGEVGFID